jgi:hypothetical protein
MGDVACGEVYPGTWAHSHTMKLRGFEKIASTFVIIFCKTIEGCSTLGYIDIPITRRLPPFALLALLTTISEHPEYFWSL